MPAAAGGGVRPSPEALSHAPHAWQRKRNAAIFTPQRRHDSRGGAGSPIAASRAAPASTHSQGACDVDSGWVDLAPQDGYQLSDGSFPELQSVRLCKPIVTRTRVHVTGFVAVDCSYLIQNSWDQWVSEYKVYARNSFRVGTFGQQLCEQICGQVLWPDGSTYSLEPNVSGTFVSPPNPAPYLCSGLIQNSPWHYVVEPLIFFPVDFYLDPGVHEITAGSSGGVMSWNNVNVITSSHAWSLEWVRHRVRTQLHVAPVHPDAEIVL